MLLKLNEKTKHFKKNYNQNRLSIAINNSLLKYYLSIKYILPRSRTDILITYYGIKSYQQLKHKLKLSFCTLFLTT